MLEARTHRESGMEQLCPGNQLNAAEVVMAVGSTKILLRSRLLAPPGPLSSFAFITIVDGSPIRVLIV